MEVSILVQCDIDDSLYPVRISLIIQLTQILTSDNQEVHLFLFKIRGSNLRRGRLHFESLILTGSKQAKPGKFPQQSDVKVWV